MCNCCLSQKKSRGHGPGLFKRHESNVCIKILQEVTNMDAAEYLRKSRMEEGMDTAEVLSKHRKALAEFAASHGIHIIAT